MARRRAASLAVAGRSLLAMLLPVPVVTLLGTVIADLAYRGSGGNLQWLNFAGWLLLAAVIGGAAGLILLVVDLVRLPALRVAGGRGLLVALAGAWLTSLVDLLVHNRDGWTAVVPFGLSLSLVAAMLALIAAWLRRPAYRGLEW